MLDLVEAGESVGHKLLLARTERISGSSFAIQKFWGRYLIASPPQQKSNALKFWRCGPAVNWNPSSNVLEGPSFFFSFQRLKPRPSLQLKVSHLTLIGESRWKHSAKHHHYCEM
jgi:hypothetical protein